MNTSRLARPRTGVASLLTLAAAIAVATAAPAWSSPSHVLPASAAPAGISLTEMAAAVAPFTMSGNSPSAYPDTPIQILYTDSLDFQVGDGVTATGAKSFTVPAGTTLYVPMFNLTDLPPLLLPFPTTAAQARSYFFDPSTHGASFELTVDGVPTTIGPSYVAGPVPVAGMDARIITLAAFIGPLSPGTHTIVVDGGVYGPAVAEIYGIAFVEETLTYTVTVAG